MRVRRIAGIANALMSLAFIGYLVLFVLFYKTGTLPVAIATGAFWAVGLMLVLIMALHARRKQLVRQSNLEK